MNTHKNIAVPARIENAIFCIRGQRVMLDLDLASLYGVPSKRLNEQVKRNRGRFPKDFMFRLTPREAMATFSLRSQNATLKKGRGRHRKYLPFVFTEHGAMMAANVLNSARATEVSVFVIRAFVRLRQMLATHKELAAKFEELEQHVSGHDDAIRALVVTIKRLMDPEYPRMKGRMGFKVKEIKT